MPPNSWQAGPVETPEPREHCLFPIPAHSWYEFCTHRYSEYSVRGMHTAAMVYWCMRFWDGEMGDIDPRTLTTEEGFEEEVSEYLDYKLRTTPHCFG